MRLFISIPCADEIIQTLLDAQAQLRRFGARANFSRPENFHLTLAFLGESRHAADAKRVLSALACDPFSLTIGGLDHFGDLYFVGIAQNPALMQLAQTLQNALRQAGFLIEERPFRPHLTLARQLVCNPPPQLEMPPQKMTVRQIHLMKSERIRGKLTYTPIFTKQL